MTKGHHKIELKAEPRAILGGKVKSLRDSGLIPAALYGKGQETLTLQVPVKEFTKVLKEAGESTLVYINVGDKSYPTIIKDVSRDPVKDYVVHADFYKVNLSEKIKAMVPVVFVGESPAVKDFSGIFVRNINELEVEALPQNLPHEISIDISSLKTFEDQILVKDIKLEGDAKIEAEADAILALVQPPKSEEELAEDLAGTEKTVDDVEVIKKEKPEEESAEEGEATQEKTGE
jgi:large subunit ribosomal protein L25